MKTDDLTQVKYIGAARMKLFNNLGITTIKQLYETPLEELARIETIGRHYAKLIKEAVTEFYAEKPEKITRNDRIRQRKEDQDNNLNLRKQIKTLNKRLKRAKEELKPLGKKKYLELYIDLKKRSNTLRPARLNTLDQNQGNLSNTVKENIIKNADTLNATLKNVGKKPKKKKKYKRLTREIQSFSKLIKASCS